MIAVKTLFEDDGSIVSIDETQGIVTLFRKPVAITDAKLREWVHHMELYLPISQRRKLAILQDMRQAPMIKDAESEKAILELVLPIVGAFHARAILIQSAIGKLQANRTSREMGLPAGVFLDEAQAMDYLRAELAKKRALDSR